ncbi:MAG: putative carboxyvinyl-carboxyphosphonate phosphorylmutase [Ramlibacter sp.]|nr:putative carboxyvinyl-carboxyphosphonate phosphorylmutase [Ramlibacter sp.]
MSTPSLKSLLQRPQPLLAPGVYDALSALVAEQAGFEALYLSGASIAYTRLGRSDIGLTTATEVAQTLAHITDRVGLPVIVDGDTGFGNALNVQRTVRDFERAGAAMIQLEDQGFPKRCGHLDGKTVIGTQEMCGKLRAAVDARRSDDTLILARTDAVAADAGGVRAIRFAHSAPGEHGGRGQDAGDGRGRPWRAGISHRHLPGGHGAGGGACLAALLRDVAEGRNHRGDAGGDAGLRRAECRHRDAGVAGAGEEIRVKLGFAFEPALRETDRRAGSRSDPAVHPVNASLSRG